MATAYACTSRLATTGSRISCGAWPNAPPMSASSSAISFVPSGIELELELPADGHAIPQRNQHGIQLFGCIHEPVEFLDAFGVLIVIRRGPRGFARPQGIVGDEQSASL